MLKREKEYIVRNEEIVIIDELKGRMMKGRRYQEGMKKEIEEKENVKIKKEKKKMEQIKLKKYLRM